MRSPTRPSQASSISSLGTTGRSPPWAYNEDDRRSFVKKIGLTLLFTLVGLVVIVLALVLIAGVPALGDHLGLPDALLTAVAWLRWPLLGVLVMAFLAGVYKVAPHRDDPEWRWVTAGSIAAGLLWLAVSALFSLYVDLFGNFEKTYGTFAAAVVLMLWFFLTAFAILIGAEINSELEHQTSADTTVGPDEPMGERGAYHADHVAAGPSEPETETEAESEAEPRHAHAGNSRSRGLPAARWAET